MGDKRLLEEMEKYFNKVSIKKITRRLLNERKIAKTLVYVSSILLCIMIVNVALVKIKDIALINTFFITSLVLYFIITVFLIRELENKDFKKLDSDKKNFYILYLLNERINKYKNDNKFKTNDELLSLCSNYRMVLYSTISKLREMHLFKVSDEEVYIRRIYSFFKNDVPNAIKNNRVDIIDDIIEDMLKLSYIVNFDLVTDIKTSENLQEATKELFDSIYTRIVVRENEIEDNNITVVIRLQEFIKKYMEIFVSGGISLGSIGIYILIAKEETKISDVFTIGIAVFFGTLGYLSRKDN